MSIISLKNLTVLIVTYKSRKVIIKNIKKISFLKKILILDNSNDIILKNLINKKFKHVKFFLSKKNLGYGAGNNFLLKKVKTKYALILNPDCYISKKNITDILNFVSCCRENFGIIGSKNEAKIIKTKNNNKKKYFFCDYVKGFFMFVDVKKLRKVNFFDENFFLYLEEVDLCKRIKQYGYSILALDDLKINHLAGKSSSDRTEYKKMQSWHWMWSQYYFSKKHYGFVLSLIIFVPKLLKFYFKFLFSRSKKINKIKFNGLLEAMLNNKSYYRG